MLLFKVVIAEAREEGIFLLKVKIDGMITRLLLERLRDLGYIEKLQFYPEINPESAGFRIPLNPGVAPVAGEFRIP